MLIVEGLTKKFDGPLFEGAGMQAEGGVLLTAPNGTGKSTLLKILAGVVLADSGRMTFKGQPLGSQRAKVGYCPSSSSGFYRRLSVRQNLVYFGALYGLPKKEVERALARENFFEIDFWDVPSEMLSDGMLQKAKIVRTLLHEPELILLDEPFNYLDTGARARLLERLRGGGATWLISQHLPDDHGMNEPAWRISGRRLERVPS